MEDVIESKRSSAQLHEQTTNKDEDDLIDSSFTVHHGGKVQKARVTGKSELDTYYVQMADGNICLMNRDEIMKNRWALSEIVGHRKGQVKIRWRDEVEATWHPLSKMKQEIPELLAEYACEKDLCDKAEWKWATKFISVTSSSKIISHQGSGKSAQYVVQFDDGTVEELSGEDMMTDSQDLLAKYCQNQNLTKAKGWEWVQPYLIARQNTWFQRVQDFMSNPLILGDYDQLTKSLHVSLHDLTLGF